MASRIVAQAHRPALDSPVAVGNDVLSLADAEVTAALSDAIDRGEIGLQVAAYLDGRQIVNACAGTMWVGGPPVSHATLFNIFSITKAFVAAAVHLQADRGLIAYDEPVARYWPEYGRLGKDRITIRDVLSHRSGAPQMPEAVSPERVADWDWVTARLAEIRPFCAPDTANTYLAMSFGWILGEVVRRTDPLRRPFRKFLYEEVCRPLGIESFFLGVTPAQQGRVATLSFPCEPPAHPKDSLAAEAQPYAVGSRASVYNDPVMRAAVLPSGGALANADSVARLFAMMACRGALEGRRPLAEATLLGCCVPRADFDRPDLTFGKLMPVGCGGFWITVPGIAALERRADSRILAHTGTGGTFAWADLDRGLALAIAHNRMLAATEPAPWLPIVEAVMRVASKQGMAPTAAGDAA